MAHKIQEVINIAMQAAEDKYRDAFQTTTGQDGNCSICLQNFNSKETLQLIKACSHFFHPNCLNKWLETKINCPLCRTRIYEDYVPLGLQRAAYEAAAYAATATAAANATEAAANAAHASANATERAVLVAAQAAARAAARGAALAAAHATAQSFLAAQVNYAGANAVMATVEAAVEAVIAAAVNNGELEPIEPRSSSK